MPTATKICRVCGKEYEYCRTIRRVENLFRWQDVACSPECGSIYFKRIQESRGITTESKKDMADKKTKSATSRKKANNIDATNCKE